MASGVKVTVSANYRRWQRGFSNLEREIIDKGRDEWTAAMEMFYDRTQEFAHVLTGEMKSSGEVEVTFGSGEITGTLTYDSEHAVWEEQRGGSHAFITRGWEATESMFERAFPDMWSRITESWG